MSRRRNTASPAAVTVEPDLHPRRSPRFLTRKSTDPSTPDIELNRDCRYSRSNQRTGSEGISLVPGSIDTSIAYSGLHEYSTLRRSARIFSLSGRKLAESRENEGKNRSRIARGGVVLGLQAARAPNVSENAGKNRSSARGRVVLGLEAERATSVCENVKESKVSGKRKRKDEFSEREDPRVVRKRNGNVNRGIECVNGWTREQELALQRAYFSEKPTPRFWKKVAKLVPGKTAQDCFDKVHSDNATPPQPLRRSRASKLNSSPIGSFSLSASKILDPRGQTLKRCSTRQKHTIAQKTVRQLLQKHNQRDQVHEADIFSLLEPCVEDSELKHVLSTPKNMQQKLPSIEKFSERSTSGQKKPLSRFSNSRQPDICTPPVLKKVKDRFLHEKYIDQLHCREAKRKAVSSQVRKFTAGKENVVVQSNYIQNVDAVKAAKNALSFDARDAIDQLRLLQPDLNSDSSDCNGDGVDDEDDRD
ncbi:hypothetical protein LINPERPRIM_LOCUS30300 [Linum perenne]